MGQEDVIRSVMPNSIEAEQSVIGSMLLDGEAVAEALQLLTGEDFYYREYRYMFDAIRALYEAGRAVDLVTLQNKLKEMEAPPDIVQMSYISDIYSFVSSSVNIREYAEIVKEKSLLRRIIETSQEIEHECFLGNEPVDVILQSTEKRIFNLVQAKGLREQKSIREIVISAIERISAAGKSDGNITGVASGFTHLDYDTAGFQPSDLILIAARPSMGKTAFVLNIVEYVAIKKKKPVALFSLEMSHEQLVNRLFSLESHIDATRIRVGNLGNEDWMKLGEAADKIGRSSLIIDDTPGITVSELRSKCRKLKLEEDIQMVIIDYLQLMNVGGGRKTDSRQQEISEISRALKAVARELNVPVIALSQLSRAVEGRPDKRPMLSDLRESGAIEQDADVVMFIYRDEYYNKDSPDKGIAEIIIAKQRNGPIGTVKLAWLPELTKFANLER